MSKGEMDLRDVRDGGFFWAQHELLDVFLPLIGSDAVMVYIALCRLIPLAEADDSRPVTLRRIEQHSGVSKSSVQRELKKVIALGMVDETRGATNRPAIYELKSLKKLASAGAEELRRRLYGVGVPAGDTGSDRRWAMTSQDVGPATRVEGAERAFDADADKVQEMPIADAPMGNLQTGVPHRDTEATTSGFASFGDLVSQNRGSVSQNEASVSQNRGSVSHTSGPFNKKEECKEEESTPLAPQGGMDGLGLGDEPLLPTADCRIGDANFALCLGIAARWVKGQLGLVSRRAEVQLAEAIQARCQSTGETLQAVAKLAVQRRREYLADMPLMKYGPWKAATFFGEGGFCWQPEAWPYDQEKRSQRSRAAVGTRSPAAETAPAKTTIAPFEFDNSVWGPIRHELQQTMNPGAFETWIRPTKGLRMDGSTLRVLVPSPEFGHIGRKYAEEISRAIEKLRLDVDALEFVHSGGVL